MPRRDPARRRDTRAVLRCPATESVTATGWIVGRCPLRGPAGACRTIGGGLAPAKRGLRSWPCPPRSASGEIPGHAAQPPSRACETPGAVACRGRRLNDGRDAPVASCLRAARPSATLHGRLERGHRHRRARRDAQTMNPPGGDPDPDLPARRLRARSSTIAREATTLAPDPLRLPRCQRRRKHRQQAAPAAAEVLRFLTYDRT